MTAGAFVASYTDVGRMMEFAGEATRSVPGVSRCRLCIGPAEADQVDTHHFPLCRDCAHMNAVHESPGYFRCHYQDDPSFFVVVIQAGYQSYGFAVLEMDNWDLFHPFEAAIFNFFGLIAMRLENLQYQKSLEERVRQRTAELNTSRQFLHSIIESSGDSICVIDRDFSLIQMNKAAKQLYGTDCPNPNQPCYSALHRRDAPCEPCPTGRVFETGLMQNEILPLPSDDAITRWFALQSFPVLDETGKIVSVVEVARDVTEIKRLQESLGRTLTEKELLLREIHHRVKNNLNVVISLLRLQLSSFDDKAMKEALNASIDRIRSMAMVHQFLYQSDTQDTIDFCGFVHELLAELSRSFAVGGAIRILPDVAKGIMVSIDTAIPVSLIINELVTNSVKYAFPDGRTGNIHVNARVGEQDEAGTRIELSVHDDGIGLPQGFTMDTSHSLGMQLVQALTHQISGELKIDGTEGTTFLITFSGERQP